MNGLPWWPAYADDWLSSKKIALMSPAEEGAYMRLLCYAWTDPDCGIDDDDDILAKLSRLDKGWFNGSSTTLRKCFVPHPVVSGKLINPRQYEEWQKRQDWREKCRAGGVKSGLTRLKKKGSSTNLGTNRQLKGNNPDPEPDPEPEKEKRGAPRKRFKPPTIEEAAEYGDAYAKEKDASFDAEVFCAFYESKNWMVGKNKMVDWRGSVRGWIGRNRDDAKGDIPTIPSGEW